MTSHPAETLRDSISSRLLVAPFVFDGMQAALAQAAGLPAVYLTGFGTAAARGYPDLGLLTMTEMVDTVRIVAGSVEIPVICDADPGYGTPVNVQRTIREYERAGAAALHIEDQVWPKRCGFFEGKEVIPTDEMVGKVRAACDARTLPAFVIIARTDALQAHGWDETEHRARKYHDAGADLVFVDGIRTEQDLEEYTQRMGDLPLVYNGVAGPPEDLEKRGVRLQIHGGTFAAIVAAVSNAMRQLAEKGDVEVPDGARVFGELLQVLGVPETLERAKRYE